jgi:hypothetical protein
MKSNVEKNPNLYPRKNQLAGNPGPTGSQRSTTVFNKRHKPTIQRTHHREVFRWIADP